MNPIRALRRAAGVTQAALAQAGGTSQPTVAAYEAGRKSPTLSTLGRLARAVRLEPTVRYHPPMTREERRSLFLHWAVAERLRTDPEAVMERARRTLKLMVDGPAGSSQFLREWAVLLERPVEALAAVLTDPEPWARELRQVTPFAGVLTGRERTIVYRRFAEHDEVPGP